jgi:hypothetical protein
MCSACVSRGNVAVLHDFMFRWQIHVRNPLKNFSGWLGLHGKSFCDKRKTDLPTRPEHLSSAWKGSAEKGK